MNNHKMSLKLVEAGTQLLNISGAEEALEEGMTSAPFRKACCMEVRKKGDGEEPKILTPKKLHISPSQLHAWEQRSRPEQEPT